MNVALSELPKFTVLPKKGNHLTAGIIVAPSLDYMHRAWLDASVNGWAKEPIIEMLIPSTLDRASHPRGSMSRACSVSISAMNSGPAAAGTRSAKRRRTRSSPRSRPTRRGSQSRCSAGKSIRRWTSSGASGASAAISSTARWGRPAIRRRQMLGAADYRMALQGLYLCGSGAHPGGEVTGAPGHNAAQAVLCRPAAMGGRRH